MVNGWEVISVEVLFFWCEVGQIIVLLGFFGVGKFILINFLLGEFIQLMFEICEEDGKGCYIIISCVLLLFKSGVMIIDMFGMCEL